MTLFKATLAALLVFATVSCTEEKVFDIRDYGAVGDSVTDCTAAVNSAVKACSEAGGGQVLVAQGTYLCSTIHLLSDVDLHIESDAVILGCPDAERYDSFVPKTDLSRYDSGDGTVNANNSRDARWNRALIIGEQVHNVSITGEGTIDGTHVTDTLGEEHMRGPHCILFAQSSGISVEGISVTRASNYAFMNYAIDNALFRNVHISQGWDGIHIRGGKNIEIDGCIFETGDDAIAGGYWEDALFHDCSINTSCNGIRMIMPSENLTVRDCEFTGPGIYPHRTSGRTSTLFGISLEPGAWGAAPGETRDILIEDVRMDGVSTPIGSSIRPDGKAFNLIVRNLVATGVHGSLTPVACWNDTGFESIELINCNISR